jgi:hypothetical protein
MNQLPREIQVNIFSHLGFKDKLESALTCRDWYSKVFNILYTEIFVECEIVVKVLESAYDESMGYQVSDLRIREIFDLLKLSELCPNLKSLEVERWMGNNWNDNNKALLAQNWKKLEVIKDALGNLITSKLLDSSYMASLTFITTDLNFQTNETFLTFIKQSKHAPALKYLTLGNVKHFNYKMLDLLHENTPNLKHLDLTCIYYLFVEEGCSWEEHRRLRMGTSVAHDQCQFQT